MKLCTHIFVHMFICMKKWVYWEFADVPEESHWMSIELNCNAFSFHFNSIIRASMWFQYVPAPNPVLSALRCFSNSSAVHLVIPPASVTTVCTIAPLDRTVPPTHCLWPIPPTVPRGVQVQTAAPLHQPTATQLADRSHDHRSNTRTSSKN
jgi:hypothetical protein